jgi:hypothetical protein
MHVKILMVAGALGLASCGTGTGIRAVGPGTWFLSEMRAPALGGGAAAEQAVMAEAQGFCAAQGRVFVPVWLRPDGDPYTPYYPTAFDATFRCDPPTR